MRLALLLPALFIPLTPASGQDNGPGKFGINFSFMGQGSVGVSWRVSPSVTLRPFGAFLWNKRSGPLGSSEGTQWSVGLDVLFRTASWDRVRTYVGVGTAFSNLSGIPSASGSQWAGRFLLGTQFKVVDRVALFGDIGAEYIDSDTFGKTVTLRTNPIGVIVFLK